MADPICRWRNTTIKQVVEFTNILPHSVMPKSEAHKYIEEKWQLWDGSNNFFKTPYQLAVQLALYYEDDTTFFPRFNHAVSPEEAQSYLSMWIRKYYVPNPYTGSFSEDSNPLILNQELLEETSHNQNISLDDFFLKHFNVELGNKDILTNLMNQFSDLSVINGYVKQKENIVPAKRLTPPSNNVNKKIFFEWFGKAENANPTKVQDPTSRQVIFYGAPGTGKSHKIKGLVKTGNHVRTTFHPDSDYASFVGAYKPTMIETFSRDMAGHVIIERGNPVKEKKIVYEFVSQAFLQAYIEAWKRSVGKMTDANGKNADMPQDMDDRYYLVIEEINRGNCAQIFGDLFQLLDRDDSGESSYAIRPDQDMKRYIAEQLNGLNSLPEAIRKGEEMKLPNNLYILATMNTSDQSLFPIDSAFKRRWDWEYVSIKDEKKGYYIKVGDTAYLWSDFLEKFNERILKATDSDDKQIGYWFVHLPEGQKEISTDKFVGKVLFYLWNDVFKDFGDGEDNVFMGQKENDEKYELRFKSFFGEDRDERIKDLMRYNNVEPTDIIDETEEDTLSGETKPENTTVKEWQAQFDNYWKGFQNVWDKAPNIKKRFLRFHSNAMLLSVDGTDKIRMRFSMHPTHWHKVSINLRVKDGTTESEMLKSNLDKIRNLTGENGYQYVVDRSYGLMQLRSQEIDFKNDDDITASYDWLISQGEKLLSALNAVQQKQ